MNHLLLKATTTAADQGTFEAVISTATIDREKDIVEPQAMVDALKKWVSVGKSIPLLWHHSLAPEDSIGHVDPASAKVVGDEVVIDGWIDQSTPRGAEAWRLVKSGTLGFSFGYMVLTGTPRKGGGTHITELDVFEVTATSMPMNGDTRVLGWKATDSEPQRVPTDAELRRRGAALGIEPPLTEQQLRRRADDQRLEVATGKSTGELSRLARDLENERDRKARDLRDLRRRSDDALLSAALGEDVEAFLDRTETGHVKRLSTAEFEAVRRAAADHMSKCLGVTS